MKLTQSLTSRQLLRLVLIGVAFIAALAGWMAPSGGNEALEYFKLIALISATVIFFAVVPRQFLRGLLWMHRHSRVAYDGEDRRFMRAILRTVVATALVLLGASLYRYEIVSCTPSTQRRFDYLVWDRWTGETFVGSAERPSFGKSE